MSTKNKNLPKYVIIGVSSFMKLGEYDYSTRGWSLPLNHVTEKDGKFYIRGFMKHLNGLELVPITQEQFEEDQGYD